MTRPVKPEPGEVLRDESDVVAVVIDPSWSDHEIQGEVNEHTDNGRWERDTWRYMTAEQYRGELGFVPEMPWWAPHGAGATAVEVAAVTAVVAL